MVNKIKTYKKLLLIIISALLVIAVYLVATELSRAQAETSTTAETQPTFTFDEQKAPGWWQGVTNETSMAVFDDTHTCFAYITQEVGVVNQEHELDVAINPDSEITGKEIATRDMTLQTNSGTKPYTLHQINFKAPSGHEPIKQATSIGFVQLEGSYLTMTSICDQPSQRSSTYPALDAMVFTEKDL